MAMDIGRPHKIMTPREYERGGYESPHVVHHNYDGFGNVAWWPLSVVFECAKTADIVDQQRVDGK